MRVLFKRKDVCMNIEHNFAKKNTNEMEVLLWIAYKNINEIFTRVILFFYWLRFNHWFSSELFKFFVDFQEAQTFVIRNSENFRIFEEKC